MFGIWTSIIRQVKTQGENRKKDNLKIHNIFWYWSQTKIRRKNTSSKIWSDECKDTAKLAALRYNHFLEKIENLLLKQTTSHCVHLKIQRISKNYEEIEKDETENL